MKNLHRKLESFRNKPEPEFLGDRVFFQPDCEEKTGRDHFFSKFTAGKFPDPPDQVVFVHSIVSLIPEVNAVRVLLIPEVNAV